MSNSSQVEVIFYSHEFENLLYGFSHCFEYANALSEFQDASDNFFIEAKALSTYLMNVFKENLNCERDLILSFDTASLENLHAALNLIIYMSMCQLRNNEMVHIKKCHETFTELKNRIEKLI